MAASWIQRWVLHLGAYRYRLQYAPGRQMLNTDALSQLPQRSPQDDDDALPGPIENNDDWLQLLGSEVYARNYGAESKWMPGHVKTMSGARIVTVETSDRVVQWHVDLVRPQPEAPEDNPAVTTTTTHCSKPDQAT
ncbi:uncharacterized protein LOC144122161 [Amblyomma americanum]